MPVPPLLKLASVAHYQAHFVTSYCKSVLITHDGIRVYFKPTAFGHAFYESSNRNGKKDVFSAARAERMDWIRATVTDPTATRFQGWNGKKKCYEPDRRVEVVYGDFVVVLQLRKAKDGTIRADFVTCYEANNSISKIRRSPLWTLNACLAVI